MKKFFVKLARLYRYRQAQELTPIHQLYDYVNQLATLYAYINSGDYRESQRDIINLRIAEIKNEMSNKLKEIVC